MASPFRSRVLLPLPLHARVHAATRTHMCVSLNYSEWRARVHALEREREREREREKREERREKREERREKREFIRTTGSRASRKHIFEK